jgi:hypothetical protein
MRESGNGKAIPGFRLRLTVAAMAGLTLLFLSRLFGLQIVGGEAYQAQADENRFSYLSLPAPRGVIYDINRSNIPSSTSPCLRCCRSRRSRPPIAAGALTGVRWISLTGGGACVSAGDQQLVDEGAPSGRSSLAHRLRCGRQHRPLQSSRWTRLGERGGCAAETATTTDT